MYPPTPLPTSWFRLGCIFHVLNTYFSPQIGVAIGQEARTVNIVIECCVAHGMYLAPCWKGGKNRHVGVALQHSAVENMLSHSRVKSTFYQTEKSIDQCLPNCSGTWEVEEYQPKKPSCVGSALAALVPRWWRIRKVESPSWWWRCGREAMSCSASRKQGPKWLASLSPLKGTSLPTQIPSRKWSITC